MPLAEQLKEHARFLMKAHLQTWQTRDPQHPPQEVLLRRVVSAAYYSVFHLLSAAVAEQISPAAPPGLRGRTQRALGHSGMASIAQQFSKPGKCGNLPSDIGLSQPISEKLATVAKNFVDLQEARHIADYDVLDLEKEISIKWAHDCLMMAEQVFNDWESEKDSEGAKVFLAALMLGDRWNKKADSKR